MCTENYFFAVAIVFSNEFEWKVRGLVFVFMLEKPAFALDASSVAGKGAVGSDDAVTRHDDSDWIGTVGETDCSDGVRSADLFGKVSVRDGCAVRDLSQCAPDLALEWCARCSYGEFV